MSVLQGLRVLVTGAGGFVGSHVVPCLRSAGASVTAIVGPPGCDLAVHADECAEIDICDRHGLEEVAAHCELIVHLAGPASVAASILDASEYARIHVCGTSTIADVARRTGARRLIYISSAEVYGRTQSERVTEDQRPEPVSPYGACKLAAEAMLSAFARVAELDVVILRPFSLYGSGAPGSSLISRILSLARAGAAIELQDLRPIRDYCFVSDFAQAVVSACAVHGSSELRVFNVGTGRGTSVAELGSIILGALGMQLPITSTGPVRPERSEIFRLVADTSRATRSLCWSSRTSLESGMRLTVGAVA